MSAAPLASGVAQALVDPWVREVLAAAAGLFLGAGLAMLLTRRESRANARRRDAAQRETSAAREEIRTELRTIEGTLRTPAAPASHELRANAAGGFAKPHFLRIDPIRMEGRGEGAGGYEGGYDAGHDAGRESGHDGGQEGRDGEEAERRAA